MEHKPLFRLERQRVKAGHYVFFGRDGAGDPCLFGKALRRTREQGLENWWNWFADLDQEAYTSGMVHTLADASEAIYYRLYEAYERSRNADLKRPLDNRPINQPHIDHSEEQKRAVVVQPMKFFIKIDKEPPKGV